MALEKIWVKKDHKKECWITHTGARLDMEAVFRGHWADNKIVWWLWYEAEAAGVFHRIN